MRNLWLVLLVVAAIIVVSVYWLRDMGPTDHYADQVMHAGVGNIAGPIVGALDPFTQEALAVLRGESNLDQRGYPAPPAFRDSSQCCGHGLKSKEGMGGSASAIFADLA